jgi:peroxiredoxin
MLYPLAGIAAVPDIPMKTLDGEEHNVNEYIGKGKWVVVAIWAHDCPICNAELYQMSFFHDDHKDKDAIVLGVSIDGWKNKAKAEAFIERHSIDFPNLITEPDARILAGFGAGPFIGTPTFYIYAPDGSLAAQSIGPTSQEDLERFMSMYPAGGK